MVEVYEQIKPHRNIYIYKKVHTHGAGAVSAPVERCMRPEPWTLHPVEDDPLAATSAAATVANADAATTSKTAAKSRARAMKMPCFVTVKQL
jgi:hypothetical protein